MIKIVPDKEGRLTQWDLNRKIIVTGYDGGAEVHFASPGDDHGAYVVKLIDGEAEIPNILLTMAGTINVYLYPDDRTVFATTLWVMAREKPDDYVYTETEVLDWRTLDEKIGDLAKLTTTAKENLVAAINEAATKGMASIYMRVAEGYIEYSGDGVNWKQLIAVAELKGDKGDKGDPGSDATVDIVTPTAESTGTQAASAKAVWDMLGGGGSGTDISLGVTGASVGDIVKVKAVDASGKPTAWEAAESANDWTKIGELTMDGTTFAISAYADGVITVTPNDGVYPTANKNLMVRNADYSKMWSLKAIETENDGQYTMKTMDNTAWAPTDVDLTQLVLEEPSSVSLEFSNIPEYSYFKVRITTPAFITHGARASITSSYLFGLNAKYSIYHGGPIDITQETVECPISGKVYIKTDIHGFNYETTKNHQMFLLVDKPATPTSISFGHYNQLMTINTKIELWGRN